MLNTSLDGIGEMESNENARTAVLFFRFGEAAVVANDWRSIIAVASRQHGEAAHAEADRVRSENSPEDFCSRPTLNAVARVVVGYRRSG